ncbi:MAG: DsbE family thiol:disulfide interchange protein [Salaquimonas sp.]|jgi:cytochrome c biogenesis protein CcmG/thiol:disulfide interchange protein DsbE|nr:DsbE family thiol:disulfide interchange protein [Salaquimonas sp.]
MSTETQESRPSRRRWLVALLPLVIFLALAAIFLRQLELGGASSTIPSALIGKPVPQFALAPLEGLTGIDGKPLAGLSADMFKGKVTVVNVWASWCSPCRVEQPLLMELAKRDDIRLVGINYKDQTANALRFLGQLGNPFSAIGVDPKGKAAIDWGVYGVPETFVVGADGRIAYKHVGPLTEENLASKFLPELEKIVTAKGS